MKTMMTYLQKHFPLVYRAAKQIWYSVFSFLTGIPKHQRLFEKIYTINHWSDNESRSGTGSNITNTTVIRRELPEIISELKARSILDLPCGDFNWMKLVDLNNVEYIGADIVRPLIEQNSRLFSTANRKFIVCDLLNDSLPGADIILCRDCLPHLSFHHIRKALENIRQSGCSYLLTSTYTEQTENKDIETGKFRPLNLMYPPFNFPSPVKIFNEGYSYVNHNCSDKSIALWKTTDLPEFI